MRPAMRRMLAVTAAAAAALVAVLLLVVHSAPVRTRVLAWSAAQLASRYDLVLTSSGFSYNALTRRVTLRDVRLAAGGHENRPFLTADRVEVRMPWIVFRGRLAFQHITLAGARVDIVRDAQGDSNLPSPPGPSTPRETPLTLDVRGLALRGLDFTYADETRDFSVSAPQVNADLGFRSIRVFEGVTGPLSIGGGVRVTLGDREYVAEPISGAMAFDGSNVSLQDLTLKAPEGTVTLKGRVNRALDAPTFALDIDGTVDLARGSAWTPTPIPVSGTANIAGKFTGPLGAFTLDLQVNGKGLGIGRERDVAIEGPVHITPGSVTSERMTLRPSTGGVVHTRFDLPFADDEPASVDAEWNGVDARSAFRMGELEPWALAATLGGRMTAVAEQPGEPLTVRITNNARGRRAAGLVPLDGSAVLRLGPRDWSLEQAHTLGAIQVEGKVGGARSTTEFLDSPLSGRAHVEVESVDRAVADLERLGIDAPAAADLAKGAATADVELAGRVREPEYSAQVVAEDLTLEGLDPMRIVATVNGTTERVDITGIEAQRGAARATADLSLDLERRTMTGTARLDAPNAMDLEASVPAEWAISGPVEADVRIFGTFDDPRVSADVSGRDLVLQGQAVDTLTARADIRDTRVELTQIDARTRDGALTGSFAYDWESEGYSAALRGDTLAWRGELGALGKVVLPFDVRYEGTGTLERPGGTAELTFLPAEGTLDGLVRNGNASARLNGESALVTAHLPGIGTFITGQLQTSAPYAFDGLAVMHEAQLAPLLEIAGARQGAISGTVSLSATARGTVDALAESSGFVNLQSLDATAGGVPVSLPSASRLAWRGDEITVDELLLAIGGGQLRATGRLAATGRGNWRGSFDGPLEDVVKIAAAAGTPMDVAAAGRLVASWESAGSLEDTTGNLAISDGRIAWGALPEVRNLNLSATADARTVSVTSLTAEWQDGGITGSASVPRRRLTETLTPNDARAPLGHARLAIVNLSEAAFAPWLSPEQLAQVDGTFSASLDADIASLSAEGVTGVLTLDKAAFTLAGVPAEQVRPARARVDHGQLMLEDLVWRVGGGTLALTGGVTFGDAGTALDLTARGTADLRALSAFLPGLEVDGAGELYVRIGGTAGAPAPDGRLDLEGAELVWSDPPVIISGLSGPILFDRTSIRAERLTANANGGELLIDGEFDLDGAAIAGGSLTAQLQNVAIEIQEGVQAEADALLTLAPTRTGWLLSGDVRVARSSFTRNISIPALAARQARVENPGRDSFGARVRLELDVHTVEDLIADNNYGRIEAGAALHVTGTAQNPALTGRVNLREGGEVYLVGRTFRVVRGAISFVDPTRIDPDLDIELRTVADGEDILLSLSGTLDQLTTNVRSATDSTRTSSELIATLLGTSNGATGAGAATLLSAEILGVTGRALGLDALRVERGLNQLDLRNDPGLLATEADPSTRLTLTKRLRPEVEVTLSQNLSESGLSAIVLYRPRRNIEIRAVQLDDSDRSYAVRHELTFGGGSSVPQSDAAPRRIVGGVRVSGLPGPSQAEVRALLRVREGDAFDFHDWQRDVGRLREWFHDRGRFEARVRATRQDLPDGRVALLYDLEEGPRTTIRVTGFALPAAAVRELEEAWSRAIFDRFLVDTARGIVQGHLIARDVIGSAVDVSVTSPSAEAKELVVEIVPGTAVGSRALAFSGNAAFSASVLEDVADAAGLARDGWLDRGGLAEVIEDAYVGAGYLDAQVSVGDPEVEGTRGVLPVTIDEGRLYRLASVAYDGVAEARRQMAAEAVQLPLEDPYRAADVEAARRAIERQYRGQGYNEVRIEARTEARPDTGEVALTFAVDEGARQVLADVVVDGATQTRPGVITSALDLETGAPVDLAAWARARKRLYDTNVFREVDIETEHVTDAAHAADGVEQIRARVTVVEWPAWRVLYGLELVDEQLDESEDGTGERNQNLGITADVLNQNLFGRAVSGGIAGRYERKRWTARTFFSTPRFFTLPVTSSVYLRTSHEEIPVSDLLSFVSDVRGITLEQRYRPSLWSELSLAYRFEQNRTYDPNPSPDDPFPLDFRVNVARLSAAGLVDRRDDPFNPARGWFSAVTWSQSAMGLGSDYKNGRLFLQQYYFQPAGPFVLASRLQVGTQYGDEPLLPSDRFYAGGATSVRGYAENALGPRDVLDRARGGNAVIIFNQEARFPVFGWVQGVAFVDAGNVFSARQEMSLGDLEIGYGLGMRLDTPFALLRVDFGFPASSSPFLVRSSSGNRLGSGRFYIGVGHIF